MKTKTKNIIQYLFFLFLGIFLLWLCFRNIDLGQTLEHIKEARLLWMFLSLLFLFTSLFFRALRWNILLNSVGCKTRSTSTFCSVLIAYMANLAVPRIGEVARCAVLSRKENTPFDKAFGTVISERIFDMIVLLLLALVVVVAQWSLLGDMVLSWFRPFVSLMNDNVWVMLAALALLSLLVLLTIIFIRRLRLGLRNGNHSNPAVKFLSGLIAGLQSILRMDKKGLFMFYTLMLWVLYIPMTWLPFMMFEETSLLTMIDAITLLGISTIGFVVPVPGGVGTYHGLVMVLLPILDEGISSARALSFATINHAVQSMFYVVAGIISYVIMFFIDKQIPLNECIKENNEQDKEC